MSVYERVYAYDYTAFISALQIVSCLHLLPSHSKNISETGSHESYTCPPPKQAQDRTT